MTDAIHEARAMRARLTEFQAQLRDNGSAGLSYSCSPDEAVTMADDIRSVMDTCTKLVGMVIDLEEQQAGSKALVAWVKGHAHLYVPAPQPVIDEPAPEPNPEHERLMQRVRSCLRDGLEQAEFDEACVLLGL